MFVYCALAVLVSCDDTDLTNPLVGSWALNGTTIQNCKDKSQNISSTYSCDALACRKYTFNLDGSLKVIAQEGENTTITNGTYVISGSTAVIKVDTRPHSITGETFTLTVSGSTLYLKEIITDLSGKCRATIVLAR